ncbi:MAG: transcription antitermination factor NusB, partial [Muribaculaceae bacterium]|nr:transcription antitermination factor NusB [Muribaculaceae bacterium]
AIAEILNYPAIPTVVTINEYIEIAKYYSTSKSGQFVNGILSSVVNYFKSQNMIFKD